MLHPKLILLILCGAWFCYLAVAHTHENYTLQNYFEFIRSLCIITFVINALALLITGLIANNKILFVTNVSKIVNFYGKCLPYTIVGMWFMLLVTMGQRNELTAFLGALNHWIIILLIYGIISSKVLKLIVNDSSL